MSAAGRMTRILHTADLHLTPDRPERWEALEAILARAEEHEVDAILVAGDFLDRSADSHALRPRVRQVLERAPAPVLILPGNHDLDAYEAGQDWGRRTTPLLERPVGAMELGGARLLAVPFPEERTAFATLGLRLAALADPARPNLLALHGTLVAPDTAWILRDTQEDEPGRYFPVSPEALGELPCRYVALGHYHQHRVWARPDQLVAYPGSPAPVGPHALGPRCAVLLELGAGEAKLEAIPLAVPYREVLDRWIHPFDEERSLEDLRSRLLEMADDRCSLRVRLDGVLAGLTEEELRSRIDRLTEELAPRFASLEVSPEGVGLEPRLAEIFRYFREELARRERAEEEDGRPIPSEVSHRALQLAVEALKAGR